MATIYVTKIIGNVPFLKIRSSKNNKENDLSLGTVDLLTGQTCTVPWLIPFLELHMQ